MPPRSIHLFVALVALSAVARSAPLEPGQIEFFETKIRPVLASECYDCHSEKKRKGDLALDSREGWIKGGESGAAIVPGKPDESLLIRSITHADADLKMPKKAPKLDARVIADFVEWVKMGAPDPRTQPDKVRVSPVPWSETLAARRKWWCFQPLLTPPAPTLRNAAWSKHPIDRLLLAKMEERGVSPTGDADARTIIRRLTYAITGLPPTAPDVERFVSDAARNRGTAVKDAADRLLGSRAFGETWARHWMDLARYAETYGSEHDYLNPYAWRYRDYLIRAFNDDLPYDRFVEEQIAGDLIAPRWKDGINEARLGSAWNRMIESYASPVDVKREEVSVVDWQIESLGKTFLGLTVQCARCHDHKFDPISADDFYGLYGVFESSRPTLNIIDDPARLTEQDARLALLKSEMRPALAARWRRDVTPAALDSALKRDAKDVLSPLREFAKAANLSASWQTLHDRYGRRPGQEETTGLFADFSKSDLAGWRVSGPGVPMKSGRAGGLSLATGDRWVRSVQPSGFFSDAVSEMHGGSLRSPEFVIEKGNVSVLAGGSGKARLRLVIENFQNDLLLFAGVNPDLDSPSPRWFTMKIKPQWIGRRARVELMTRDDKTCVGEVKDQGEWQKSDGRSAFGIQRVVLHDGAAPSAPAPFPPMLWQAEPIAWGEFTEQLSAVANAAIDAWVADRADDEDARLIQALLEGGVLANKAGDDPACDALVSRFRDAESKIPVAARAPGVQDDGYSTDSPIFPRGDHTHPGKMIARRFPEVLGGAPLGGAGSGRLELAHELTRRDNPLTARVMVNRVWQHLTGRGLVATPDNFGKMGEKPTHPELLDHLAAKFMADGWSVKSLIRYIVTSRAWQLAAESQSAAEQLDPANDLLSHARARRLDAEEIRDAMLAVAGNLAPNHSGPGMRVYYRTVIDPVRQPPAGPIDGDGRRSVYIEARRLFQSDFLAAFDAPKPNIFTGRRSETNVPAQSLTLLNDPFVRREAELWGRRIAARDGTDEQRIAWMYEDAFAREPSPDEISRAREFLRRSETEPFRELAHALFNMKEFIYLR